MADELAASKVSLVYNGGLASTGQLHLYEFSRAVYGFSRLIQTLEHYRRQGRVAQRIVGDANTDIIVSTPQKGSFIFDALVLVSGQVIPALKDIPFDVLLSFVMDLMKGSSKSNDETILQLAQIRLAEERERTSQSGEETKRIEAIERMVESQSATLKQALDLTNWALKSRNVAIGRAEIQSGDLIRLRSQLESDVARNERLGAYEDQLTAIPQEDIAKLTSRTRPVMQEIGLPLRKSAETVGFKYDDAPAPFVQFDREDIDFLDSRLIDDQDSSYVGSFKSYDRESGLGKFRELPLGKIHNFIIPANSRTLLQDKISDALRRTKSVFVGKAVRDHSQIMTSIIISDIHLG
ncbi:DUF7946 domain-containing protein [Microvirga soli]|uniref:DUF7946 domain-containing protein n=1 Tax=Microvirga soli TaxID=1854496 RepID=UPI00191E1DCC|nr:hypothetical protein [Microvirga soli]